MGLLDWLLPRKSPAPVESDEQSPDDPQLAALLNRAQSLREAQADDTGNECDFTESTSIPVGQWLRFRLPDRRSFVGYTYVESQAGLSVKGSSQQDPELAEAPIMTVRLPMPRASWRTLGPDEVEKLGLPARPAWLEVYGPQPSPGTRWAQWREHGKLRDRFHPEHPDDLQVLVHDGGPRLTDRRPELIWVRTSGVDGDLFMGRVLNKPHQLITVSEGSEIQFLVPETGEHPLQVTAKYLGERPDWIIQACSKCGLSELFDAPSDLIRVVFPGTPAGAVMSAFTAFCGACGGLQLVRHKSFDPGMAEHAAAHPSTDHP